MRKLRTSFILLVMVLIFSSCKNIITTEHASIIDKDKTPNVTFGLLDPNSEVRGIWIATVGNINYPTRKGLSVAKLKSELDDIVSTCVELGLNTIYFQVRPSADALYKSELFPQSEFVSGQQGKAADGDFDSLGYLIEKAYDHKINVHAWVNPLRVTYGSAKYPQTDVNALSKDHIAHKNPEWVIAYDDGKLYFDAGNPDVRDYISAGVREIVENYAVDGVVFDDYFYPYPVKNDNGYAFFNDDLSYSIYGRGQRRDDWRRENINKLIESCYNSVKSVNSECDFGISPFGIWQNDNGNNGGSKTRGLEAYNSLYCDALAWVNMGCVDYIAPQLYWRFETTVAPYGELVDWWNSVLAGTGVKLLISHAAYMYDDGWNDPQGELESQVEYAREKITYRGSILYGYSAVRNNSYNIDSEIKSIYEHEIIYSEMVSNQKEFEVSIPKETEDKSITIIGICDPTKMLYFGSEKILVNRDGTFEIKVVLDDGENELKFVYDDNELIYKIVKKTLN